MSQADERALRKSVALVNIVRDMQFVARVAHDIAADQKNTIVASMTFMPLASLMVHEAAGYLRQSAPEYSDLADLVKSQELTASRHSVKLFDGDSYRVLGITELFEEGFLVADKSHFIESIKLKLARPLGVDVGLTFMGSDLIYTTQALQFNLGLDPGSAYESDVGARMQEMARQVAAFATNISRPTGVDAPGESFIGECNDEAFHMRDTVAEIFYRDLADVNLAPGLSVSLAAVCGSMNLLVRMVGADRSAENGPTSTKLHYIVLWHASRALEEIRSRAFDSLGDQSQGHLVEALDHGSAAAILDGKERRLRNALTHYGLNKFYPVAQLDVGRPLSGLVETVYPNLGFLDFQELVYERTERVAGILNRWLDVPPTIGRPV